MNRRRDDAAEWARRRRATPSTSPPHPSSRRHGGRGRFVPGLGADPEAAGRAAAYRARDLPADARPQGPRGGPHLRRRPRTLDDPARARRVEAGLRARHLLSRRAPHKCCAGAGASRTRGRPHDRSSFDDPSLFHAARVRSGVGRPRHRCRRRGRRGGALRQERGHGGASAHAVLSLPRLRRHAGPSKLARFAEIHRFRRRPVGRGLDQDDTRLRARARAEPARQSAAPQRHHPVSRHRAVDGGDAAGAARRATAPRLHDCPSRPRSRRAGAAADACRQGLALGNRGDHRAPVAADPARRAPRGQPPCRHGADRGHAEASAPRERPTRGRPDKADPCTGSRDTRGVGEEVPPEAATSPRDDATARPRGGCAAGRRAAWRPGSRRRARRARCRSDRSCGRSS